MLVLSRKADEEIVIGDRIVLTVLEIRGDKVRLGFEAPKDVVVHRTDFLDPKDVAVIRAKAKGSNA